MTEAKKPRPKRQRAATPAKETPAPKTKIEALVALMRRPGGASVKDLMKATGWQAHSVRGAISGSVKKKLKLSVLSAQEGDTRIYRIAP